MPRYRPFLDGPLRLHMGLRALEPANRIEPGDGFDRELAQRRHMLDDRGGEVFAALPESLAGQAEVLELLLDHLLRRGRPVQGPSAGG